MAGKTAAVSSLRSDGDVQSYRNLNWPDSWGVDTPGPVLCTRDPFDFAQGRLFPEPEKRLRSGITPFGTMPANATARPQSQRRRTGVSAPHNLPSFGRYPDLVGRYKIHAGDFGA